LTDSNLLLAGIKCLLPGKRAVALFLNSICQKRRHESLQYEGVKKGVLMAAMIDAVNSCQSE